MVQVMIVFFSWDRIPKLLDLLAEMDQIRREVSEKAKSRLLAYEVYMHEHPDDEEVLDDGERDILGWWTNPVIATDLRREYHHITLQLREHVCGNRACWGSVLTAALPACRPLLGKSQSRRIRPTPEIIFSPRLFH